MDGGHARSQSADWDRARAPAPAGVAASSRRLLLGGGTAGNERLTAVTGVLLIVLLAALGVTILRIRPLLAPHMFIGLLLIPAVLLKMASTGYRFARYYTNSPTYRHKGPPPAALRVLAPGVVLTTIAVFATGVALMVEGPSSRGSLLELHKVTFIVWIVLTALHVLGHLRDVPAALGPRHDPAGSVELTSGAGGAGRALSLAGVLVAGVVLAILYVPEFAPWLHAHLHHH